MAVSTITFRRVVTDGRLDEFLNGRSVDVCAGADRDLAHRFAIALQKAVRVGQCRAVDERQVNRSLVLTDPAQGRALLGGESQGIQEDWIERMHV